MTDLAAALDKKASPASEDPPVLSSQELLAGRREVIIQHGKESYRLRLTNNNKLILFK